MKKPTVRNVIEFKNVLVCSIPGHFFRMGSINICASLQEFLGDELSFKNNAPKKQTNKKQNNAPLFHLLGLFFKRR